MTRLVDRAKAKLAGAMARLLSWRYVGKPLEVRAYDGSGRTRQKSATIYESSQRQTLLELREIDGVTFMRDGKNFLFFLNASRPTAPEPGAPAPDLGPFSGRATRVMKNTRKFNYLDIKTDPDTGAFYYLEMRK